MYDLNILSVNRHDLLNYVAKFPEANRFFFQYKLGNYSHLNAKEYIRLFYCIYLFIKQTSANYRNIQMN